MSDLGHAVVAWEHTAAVLALGRDCDGDDFDTPTECPGWTVQDQLAHVAGVERWLAPGLPPDPPHDLPEMAHMRSEFGRRVERAVDLRRTVSGAEVVAELAEALDARCALARRQRSRLVRGGRRGGGRPGRQARGVVLTEIPDGGGDVRIGLGTEAFMRRSAGRWPVERTPAEVEGDRPLGARVLEALAVTPDPDRVENSCMLHVVACCTQHADSTIARPP